jgi:PRTRC genetic system protein C
MAVSIPCPRAQHYSLESPLQNIRKGDIVASGRILPATPVITGSQQRQRKRPASAGLFLCVEVSPNHSNWDANETFKERTKMTVLKTAPLLREFYYNGVRIPDPGPGMTVEQVRDLLTPTYPEMATASLSGPEDMGDVLRYTFTRAIGSKG